MRSVFVAATLAGAIALVPGVASAATVGPAIGVGAGASVTISGLASLGLGATVSALGGLTSAATTTPGFNVFVPIEVNVPGTVGGSATCVSTLPRCVTLPGISDLTVTANVQVNGLLGAPLVTPVTAVSGCTAPGDTGVGATITPSALGSADVSVDIFDSAGSLGPINIPLTAGGKSVTITECVS